MWNPFAWTVPVGKISRTKLWHSRSVLPVGGPARPREGFGVKLGSVRNVQVDGRNPIVHKAAGMAMRAEAADAGDFSPGVIQIERFVQATFAIETAAQP